MAILYDCAGATTNALASVAGCRVQEVVTSLRRYWAWGYCTKRRWKDPSVAAKDLPPVVRRPFEWSLTTYGRERVEAWKKGEVKE